MISIALIRLVVREINGDQKVNGDRPYRVQQTRPLQGAKYATTVAALPRDDI